MRRRAYAGGVGIVTTPFERALHLLLFVAGGVAFAVVALSVLERFGGRSERSIRPVYMAIPVAIVAALFVAERVYHAMH